jgi:hypothetical protein
MQRSYTSTPTRRLGPPGTRCVCCNSYRYRIVKEPVAWKSAPERRDPFNIQADAGLPQRTRHHPADQESLHAFRMRRLAPSQITDNHPKSLLINDLTITTLYERPSKLSTHSCRFPKKSRRRRFVEMGGLEPPASWMQATRSPSELHPPRSRLEWAYLDSNQGPQLYQSCALAN